MPTRLPNFLFIGPDKAGSTWLYEALRRHKQVYMSQVKELFFFDRFYDKGWRWYTSFFKGAGEAHHVVGEICHDYLFSPLACQRIARDLPSAKLMVCLREPSERAFSEYLYLIKVGLLTCDFETALREVDELVDHGRYAKHLSCYLDRFRREQLLVAVFDDLQTDPQRFFDGICDFLGLKQAPLASELKQKVLPAAKPRMRRAARLARGIGQEIRRRGWPGIVGTMKGSALLSHLLYCPYGPGEKPGISPCTQEYLYQLYSPEVQRLDELLGVRLSARWGYGANQ